MALKDVVTGRKNWAGNVYTVLERFLTSNVGERWDDIYSHICSVAPAGTFLGREIRHAVEQSVDTKGPIPYPHDYYVDEQGILRKSTSRVSYRKELQERRSRKPIIKIFFVDDGNDLWYQFDSVSVKFVHSKTVPSKHKEWFRFERRHIDESYPIYEYVNYVRTRQIGTKPVVREEIHRFQCDSKMAKKLRLIASRRTKILKLINYHYDDPGLTAYVKGGSNG
jgi:hypothetical protein